MSVIPIHCKIAAAVSPRSLLDALPCGYVLVAFLLLVFPHQTASLTFRTDDTEVLFGTVVFVAFDQLSSALAFGTVFPRHDDLLFFEPVLV